MKRSAAAAQIFVQERSDGTSYQRRPDLRAASSTSALQPATKLCRGGEQNASLVLEPKWRRRSIDQIVTINDVGLLDRSGMIIPAAVQVTRGRRADP